jgi:hypothetical protein
MINKTEPLPENQQSNAQTINDNGARQIERLREALEDAADMLHECALECSDCDYGNGATGKDSEGEICEECAPVREAERRAREMLGDDDE